MAMGSYFPTQGEKCPQMAKADGWASCMVPPSFVKTTVLPTTPTLLLHPSLCMLFLARTNSPAQLCTNLCSVRHMSPSKSFVDLTVQINALAWCPNLKSVMSKHLVQYPQAILDWHELLYQHKFCLSDKVVKFQKLWWPLFILLSPSF